MSSNGGVSIQYDVNEVVIELPNSMETSVCLDTPQVIVTQILNPNLSISEDVPLISVTEVCNQGVAGPPGPQGIQGPPGPPGPGGDSAFAYETINVVVSNPANVSHTLPNAPRTGSLSVFLNGIRENNDSIILSGNIVNFMSLELGVGDLLTFDYQYQV